MRVEYCKTAEDHIPAVLERVRKEYIIKHYGIKEWTDCDDFLEKMARKSGKLLKVSYYTAGKVLVLSAEKNVYLHNFGAHLLLTWYLLPVTFRKFATFDTENRKICN